MAKRLVQLCQEGVKERKAGSQGKIGQQPRVSVFTELN